MSISNYLRKIRLLLENVFEGKISLSENNYHKEELLRLLADRTENSLGKKILDSPCFSGLIFHLLENINNNCTAAKVLLIEIVTILFKNELQFTKMQMHGFQKFYSEFCILGNLNNVPPPDLHLACIKLATVQVTHCSGLAIIKENKVWKNILYPNLHHRPKQISDAAYNFMAKLVWKLNNFNNEQELLDVLGHIVGPILSSEYLNVLALNPETDTELCDKIYTHLSALLAVLTEADNHTPVNKVMYLLKDHFIVDHRLCNIFSGTKNTSLLKILSSCLFRFYFGVSRHLLFTKQIDDFCNRMTAFHRNYLLHAIQKREAIVVIDFIIQSNIIWSHFKKTHATEFDFPLTFEMNGQKYEYCLQIIVHLLMPMAKYSSLHRCSNKVAMTDTIEQFIVKIGSTVTDYIYSMCYMFGALLEEGGAAFRKKVTTHTLKELLRLNGHITDSQAGPIFQSLYYLLEIFISCDEAGGLVECEDLMDQDTLRLLSHLLEGMKMLLKEHNIPWYENLEIVNIQTDFVNLLKQSFLTTKQVVQVLDLINICVKKFLSPNMSLLVDSKCTNNSTICEIGKAIRIYSQHEDWEVRDSAFNLLNSCTEICFIKYVPLQKIIKNKNLIILAAKAALTDPEFYSQCTALKCLSAATKIDNIWQEVIVDNPQLYSHLIYLLKNHEQGMARKEVVNVLTAVYTNQKIQVQARFHNTLYEVMLTAAINALNWEVQTAALNFWKIVIQDQLTYRGMLDGKFPPVTFSKEKRKIIVLDDTEIQRQLTAIMTDLSNVGCLTVLIECMNEMYNIEVIQQAYSIAKELVEMLDKYKFQVAMKIVEPESVTPKYMEQDNMPLNLCKTSEDEKNKVIDGILSANHTELIMKLHDNYYRMKSEEMDTECAYSSRRELVKPNEFLEMFTNKDYSLIIEDKMINPRCLSTLDGLLDRFLICAVKT